MTDQIALHLCRTSAENIFLSVVEQRAEPTGLKVRCELRWWI